MTKSIYFNVIDKLTDVMDQVRVCLKAGQFEDLKPLVDQQTDLMSKLENNLAQNPPSEFQLDKLALDAKRNKGLLEAAQMGIRSAGRRKTDIRDTRSLTLTYNRQGKRIQMNANTGNHR